MDLISQPSGRDVLIVVDVQNDFCPGGALAVPGGDEVAAIASRLGSRYDEDPAVAAVGAVTKRHAGVDPRSRERAAGWWI